MKLNAVHPASALDGVAPSGAHVRSVDSDLSLALRMAIGDTHATALLFARYGGLLFGLAACMLGDEAAAESTVIGAFEAACIDARTLSRQGSTVKEFMVQHVRSHCIELIRARRTIARTIHTAGNTLSHGDGRDV